MNNSSLWALATLWRERAALKKKFGIANETDLCHAAELEATIATLAAPEGAAPDRIDWTAGGTRHDYQPAAPASGDGPEKDPNTMQGREHG